MVTIKNVDKADKRKMFESVSIHNLMATEMFKSINPNIRYNQSVQFHKLFENIITEKHSHFDA